MFNRMCFIVFTVIVTLLVWGKTATAQVITDGLVSYWTFDNKDIEGDTVTDIFGEHHGIMKGNPEVVEGKVSQALKFGGNDYVDFGDQSSLNIDPPLTVSMYLNNMDDTASFLWQGGEPGGATKNYIYVRPDGGMNVGQWPPGGGDLNSEKELLERDTWYYISVVFNEKYLLYIDGSLKGEFQSEVYSGPTPTGWLLGTRLFPANAAYYFKGMVDELAVYNRDLSENEINQNMNSSGWSVVSPTNKSTLTWGQLKNQRNDE